MSKERELRWAPTVEGRDDGPPDRAPPRRATFIAPPRLPPTPPNDRRDAGPEGKELR